MQRFSETAQSAVLRQWNLAADAAAESIGTAPTRAEAQARAELALGRYRLVSVEVTGFGEQPLRAGRRGTETVTMERKTASSLVRVGLDDSELRTIQQRFAATASIAVAAAVTGMVMLLLFIPRITRPVEAMLDHAREIGTPGVGQDETTYLIDTFGATIQRLRAQELELKHLHESEKNRADALELVSATLTRSLTSGFIALDSDAQVLQMNSAARDMLAIPPDRPLPGDVEATLGPSPLADVLRSAVHSADTLSRIEVLHPLGEGPITIGLTAVPLLGEHSRILGMLALFTDLTPIKRLEAQIRAMQTLADVGEIASGIAHEFRNSLSTILGYLKLLQRMELTAEAASRVRAAESEATQLTAAVERLLTFSRPMKLEIEDVDLREIADEVAERLHLTLPATTIEVSGHGHSRGDRALLMRAVDNVVRNAVDAVAEQGEQGRVRITVSTTPPGITVVDNGPGFGEADPSRLLLPFVSNKPGGFGLGLSIARKVMVQHGGEIALESLPTGGAAVRLTFSPADQFMNIS